MIEAAAIILAGGKSSRMGQNKALVRVTEGGILEGIIRVLSPEFPEIIISANNDSFASLNIKTVTDIYKDRGPLGGIHSGLLAAGYDTGFFMACDMPFTDIGLVQYMIEAAPGYDAVVPKTGEYFQPLFAVYTKNCLQAIDRQLRRGHNKIISFFPEIRVRHIGFEEIIKFGDPEKLFFNVNTPNDLRIARAMAGRELNGS